MNLKPQTGAYIIFYHLNLNTPSSSSGRRLISILMGSFPLISYAALLLLLSRFSRVRLCDPIDGSPSDSPIPGILQARTLEWVAISFSSA